MARATVGVLVKCSPEEVAAIDAARGSVPRTVWIKEACRRELARETASADRGWRALRIIGNDGRWRVTGY